MQKQVLLLIAGILDIISEKIFYMYVTTPIYYVNDIPHIGHAYTSIICDVIARFHRLSDKKVKFVTGTDEHGQKVERSAQKCGLSSRKFVDQVSEKFIYMTNLLHLSNDDFIRTTEPRHKKSVQCLWQKIENNGFLYKGFYEGWYSIRDEAFYQEQDLVSGKAPTGSDVEWMKESSYFFKLSEFQDRLLSWYEENQDFVFPNTRYNEVLSFVRSGLKDISISRTSFDWGVKVPKDNQHVIYVWLDALSNYLTAIGFPDCTGDDYLDFWQNNDETVHVIGKDILRFHAVYWPAFLMAADLPLPKRILAHSWWKSDGEKMSKSVGNVINPVQVIEEFNVDSLRYFLIREMSWIKDGNFSKDAMIARVNSDLADNIGNLMHRVFSFIHKNCNGKVPNASVTEKSDALLQVYSLVDRILSHIKANNFVDALKSIIEIGALGNQYIDKQAPWKLRKTDSIRMEHVLYDVLEMLRCIGILLQPFIPGSADKILNVLSIKKNQRQIKHAVSTYAIQTGVDLHEAKIIFCKICLGL